MIYLEMLLSWLTRKRRGSDRSLEFDFDLQVLYVQITSAGRSFNEVTDYVKKVEGVTLDGQYEVLAKSANNF